MTIQDIFNRIEESKEKLKESKLMIKEALEQTPEHKELCDKIKILKSRKKVIELGVKKDFAHEIEQMEDLKIDIEADKELLADASITALMKGQTVEVEDKYKNKYEPLWGVKFKKA